MRCQILTGATGSLGAHILSQLLNIPAAARIVCLVRGATPEASKARVSKSLSQRYLDQDVEALVSSERLLCIPCNLSNPNLGLDYATYSNLVQSTSLIVHAAWSVNFNTRLRSFVKDHIAGVNHVLAFAASSHKNPQLLFCSSTASVASFTHTRMVSERVSVDPHTATPLGYSRSKWVAEKICERVAFRNDAQHLQKHSGWDRIKIARIGQLCGDTRHGVWNMSEAWPLILSTSSPDVIGGLPDLSDEPLGWLPVDRAAEAIVRITGLTSNPISASNPRNRSFQSEVRRVDEGVTDAEVVSVFHILNPDTSVTWQDLLAWVKEREPGLAVLDKREWLRRLENLKEHPAKKLIGLWKEAFGSLEEDSTTERDDRSQNGDAEKQKGNRLRYDITNAEAILGEEPGLRIDEPVTKELFEKMYGWIARISVQYV